MCRNSQLRLRMNSSFCRLESIDRLNYISILSTGDDSISLLILSILLFSSPPPPPLPSPLSVPFLFITCILQIALRSDVVFYRRSYDHRVSHGIDNLFCLRKYNGEMYFIFDESRVTEIGVYRRTAGGLILK